MSRSHYYTKKHKITMSRSEKKDKRLANRQLRSVIRTRLNSNPDFDDWVNIDKRDVSNVYSFDGDGKTYWEDMDKSYKSWRK